MDDVKASVKVSNSKYLEKKKQQKNKLSVEEAKAENKTSEAEGLRNTNKSISSQINTAFI